MRTRKQLIRFEFLPFLDCKTLFRLSLANKEVREALNSDESSSAGVSHLKRVAAINFLSDGEQIDYEKIDAQFGFAISQIKDFGRLDGEIFKN